MYHQEDIIATLGIQQLPKERRDAVVEVAMHRIGLAVTQNLSEQQFNEYEAIVNNDHTVISTWLSKNVPDYKDSPVYQSFVEGYEADPERNDPAKLFATVAWIQANVPNLQERIDKTLAQVKRELDETAAHAE